MSQIKQCHLHLFHSVLNTTRREQLSNRKSKGVIVQNAMLRGLIDTLMS